MHFVNFGQLKHAILVQANAITDGSADAKQLVHDAHDMVFIVNRELEYLCANVVMQIATSNQPSIHINTKEKTVEGQWGTDYVKESYEDNIGLEDTLKNKYHVAMVKGE